MTFSSHHSSVETTHLVLPPDTNQHGTAFGGRIMEWMDIAAAIAAGRHCRHRQVVTAAVDELVFRQPIRQGDVVTIRASVNYVHKTSMEVGVRVDREDAETQMREHCLTGYFTFVGLDQSGLPAEVPPLLPQTHDEKRRFTAGEARRTQRINARNRSTAG